MKRGCWVAAVTPMHLDGTIDLLAWEQLLLKFVQAKVAGVVVLGTTGESACIKLSEREQLLQIAQQTLTTTEWLVGTGHNDLAQALILSKQAQKYQANGIMVVTPYYNKPMSSGIVKYYQAILDSVDLPLIAYNVPSRTGTDVSMEVWDSLYQHSNFIGIKEANADVNRAYLYRQRYPNLLLFSGNDEHIRPWISLGGDGVISVIANAWPELVVELCHTELNSNQLQRALTATLQATNPIAIKCILHKLGLIELGIRLPLDITEEIYQRVISKL